MSRNPARWFATGPWVRWSVVGILLRCAQYVGAPLFSTLSVEWPIINDFGGAVFAAEIAADEFVSSFFATVARPGAPDIRIIPSVTARIKRSLATARGADDGEGLGGGV